jgi:multidrug efflux pump subunit AcrB
VPVFKGCAVWKTIRIRIIPHLQANFIRTQLATVQGASVPWPYGGRQRQVQVDLDTAALQAKGLSPLDVVNAVSTQNLILPSGTSKVGVFEYDVEMNGSPRTVAELNDLPVKTTGNSVVYIRLIKSESSDPRRFL